MSTSKRIRLDNNNNDSIIVNDEINENIYIDSLNDYNTFINELNENPSKYYHIKKLEIGFDNDSFDDNNKNEINISLILSNMPKLRILFIFNCFIDMNDNLFINKQYYNIKYFVLDNVDVHNMSDINLFFNYFPLLKDFELIMTEFNNKKMYDIITININSYISLKKLNIKNNIYNFDISLNYCLKLKSLLISDCEDDDLWFKLNLMNLPNLKSIHADIEDNGFDRLSTHQYNLLSLNINNCPKLKSIDDIKGILSPIKFNNFKLILN